MEIRSPAQGQPRRSPVVLISLTAVLLVLTVVATVFYASQRAKDRERKEYLATLAARNEAYAAANGTTQGVQGTVSTGATPTAHEVLTPGGTVEPVQWMWTGPAGESGTLTSIDGCLVTAPGVDVLWHGGDLYVEKQAGVLRRVWHNGEEGAAFVAGAQGEYCSVCYDTRYVWAPLTRKDAAPRLIVLDPQTEDAWEFTDEAGGWEGVSSVISGREIELRLAPSQPGSVCWPRVSAKEQWLGLLEFSPPSTRQARAFTLPPMTDLKSGLKEMLSLGRIAAGTTPLIVLGRMQYPQLVIDPVRQTAVRANHNSCPGIAGHVVVHEQAVWWALGRSAIPGFPQSSAPSGETVYRASLPDLAEQVGLLRAPAGLLVVADNKLYILGERVGRWGFGGADVEVLEAAPPWSYRAPVLLAGNIVPTTDSATGDSAKPSLERAFLSSHHGLLARASEPDGIERCFAITWPPSPAAP